MNRTIAYLHVSTPEQDLDKNKFEILQVANQYGFTGMEWVEKRFSFSVSLLVYN